MEISGQVFEDVNQNGVKDEGEEDGSWSVFVELLQDGVVISNTTTNANSGYSFTDLGPGDYQVQFESPADYNFTTQNVGLDDTLDSDVDRTGITDIIVLAPALQSMGTFDAGLYALSSSQQTPVEESGLVPAFFHLIWLPVRIIWWALFGGHNGNHDGHD
jgi:hypothetical protein